MQLHAPEEAIKQIQEKFIQADVRGTSWVPREEKEEVLKEQVSQLKTKGERKGERKGEEIEEEK